jgi:hypothetical protein
VRFCNAKLFHQLFETSQIVTLSLATPIQVLPQRTDGMEIERIETEGGLLRDGGGNYPFGEGLIGF